MSEAVVFATEFRQAWKFTIQIIFNLSGFLLLIGVKTCHSSELTFSMHDLIIPKNLRCL
jgi:hypothetical protein